MHGDSFSARWVEPDPKTNSTSFGLMADPPNLPGREDVLVENGAASPKSCFPSFKMRTTTAAGGLLPTGKTSTPKNTTFNEPFLRFYLTAEAKSKETNYGLQLHSPGMTTAVPGEINRLLPPLAGGSLRQNSGRIEHSIQEVLKVVSALARVWERGARCFVVWIYVLERLNETAKIFGGTWYGRKYLCRTYSEIAGPLKLGRLRKCCARKIHAVESGLKLREGRT